MQVFEVLDRLFQWTIRERDFGRLGQSGSNPLFVGAVFLEIDSRPFAASFRQRLPNFGSREPDRWLVWEGDVRQLHLMKCFEELVGSFGTQTVGAQQLLSRLGVESGCGRGAFAGTQVDREVGHFLSLTIGFVATVLTFEHQGPHAVDQVFQPLFVEHQLLGEPLRRFELCPAFEGLNAFLLSDFLGVVLLLDFPFQLLLQPQAIFGSDVDGRLHRIQHLLQLSEARIGIVRPARLLNRATDLIP